MKTHKVRYDGGEKGEFAVNVLLVRPRVLNLMTIFGAITCEPLELKTLLPACRVAVTKAFLYDGVTESRRCSNVLREKAPDLVAITGYLTQEGEVRAYAKLAKSLLPRCIVVLGGVHAQLNSRWLYWPEADYVFRGESAKDFQHFVEALKMGKTPDTAQPVPTKINTTGKRAGTSYKNFFFLKIHKQMRILSDERAITAG